MFSPKYFSKNFQKIFNFFFKNSFYRKKFKKVSNIFPKRFLTNLEKKFGIGFGNGNRNNIFRWLKKEFLNLVIK